MQTKNSAEKYKKTIKRRRIFVLIVFAAIILLCVCLFTPIFAVNEISVLGNSYLAAEDIIAASGIEKGENVFRISEKRAVKKLAKLSYIEDADIKRKFPAKIVIEVLEAKHDLIIDTPNEFVVTTIGGRVLEKTDDVTELMSPIVYGVEILNAEPAKKIEPKDKDKFESAVEYITCFYNTTFWKDIDEFYTEDAANFVVMMKSGMKITFGDVTNLEILKRKIKMCEQIFPQIKQTKNSYLDLTTDKGYFGEYTEEELAQMKEREESGKTITEALEDAQKEQEEKESENKETERKKENDSKKDDENDE